MSPTSAILTDALTLTPVDQAEGTGLAYVGTTQPCPWPKAYGGDMVAQAAVAAMRSAPDDRTMHSMHSYFMRPVDIGGQVRYDVEVLRDGRGYSTRSVRGVQGGKTAYVAMASFHTGADSGTYAAAAPTGIPAPESLPDSATVLADVEPGTPAAGSMTPESKAYWAGGRGVDMRHVPGPVYVEVEGGTQPQQAVWVKPFDALRPVDGLTEAQVHQAALAYVCDYTILEPVLRVLGHPWAQPGLVTASLDHAMWFHRPADLTDWLLYAQEAVAADHGRGLGLGRFFTRSGEHVATVAQEGMIRAAAP